MTLKNPESRFPEGDPLPLAQGKTDSGGSAPPGHHHHHHGAGKESGRRLLVTLALNLIIPAVQIVGGLMANSMALVSDAVHNFSDFTALLISYVAWRIGRRGASVHNTFGYRRAEIMASLINVALLVGATGVITYGAVSRLLEPAAVSGWLVFWIAGIGVAGNGFSALLLHGDAKHNLNVRGAFLHMVGDLMTSVVVVINGLVLVFYPWYWLDPLLSLLIVVFILMNCWTILVEATHILMNATPRSLDLESVHRDLERMPGVCGVHHLHVWNLSSTGIAFMGHVVVPEQPVSQTEALAGRLRQMLLGRYGIDHATFQFETEACGNGDLLCENGCAVPAAHGQEHGQPRRQTKHDTISKMA